MLCCLIAALLASPLLAWPPPSRPACCGPQALPLVLAGLAVSAGLMLLCLVLFTTSGAGAFRHICSVAAWRWKGG